MSFSLLFQANESKSLIIWWCFFLFTCFFYFLGRVWKDQTKLLNRRKVHLVGPLRRVKLSRLSFEQSPGEVSRLLNSSLNLLDATAQWLLYISCPKFWEMFDRKKCHMIFRLSIQHFKVQHVFLLQNKVKVKRNLLVFYNLHGPKGRF